MNDRHDAHEDGPFQALKNQIAHLNLRDGEQDDREIEDETLKVVEKIESLCMSCEENVRILRRNTPDCLVNSRTLGRNKTPAYKNPLLPRNHLNVLFLRPLRLFQHRG